MSDGEVEQLADADQLSQAIHDLRVAKKEIDNYHAGGKIAVAITKIEEVRDDA